jgi:hypothetical protein
MAHFVTTLGASNWASLLLVLLIPSLATAVGS